MTKIYDEYDAIIIGAGIGGLVCGCYLAKIGMKVLIIEKNSSVGGYCTSFRRGSYRFDSSVHYLGSCRRDGQIGKAFNELQLENEINLIRSEISDTFITPYLTFFISTSSFGKTISLFQERFKQEAKNIELFFNFITNSNFTTLYVALKNKTFADLLHGYFTNSELIRIFNALTMCIGMPIESLSALAAVVLLKEYLIDGGYYPKGGMQSFSNGLMDNYKKRGGSILLSAEVTKIICKNGQVDGIECGNNGPKVHSKIVVANNNASDVFLKLLKNTKIEKKFINRLKSLKPTISAFIVYLGLKYDLGRQVEKSRGLWFFDNLDTANIFKKIKCGILDYESNYFLCAFTSFHDSDAAPINCNSIHLVVGAPFKDNLFWNENKDRFAECVINRADKVIGNVSNNIEIKEIATPQTLYRYTYNTEGSLYGWESSIEQCNDNLLPQEVDFIKNLYLVGHWTTHGSGQGGLGMVFYSARKLARIISKQKVKKYVSI